MQKKKVIVAALAGLSISASAAIYVAPSDIDTYKQKTDQTFYDMYQNKDSAIANGNNQRLKPYTSGVDTSTRMFEGATINKIAQSSISGDPIRSGTSGTFSLAGHTYTVAVDRNGRVSVSGYGAANKTLVKLTGKDAQQNGSAWCGSSGKYGCQSYRRRATEYFFDVSSAILTTANVTQAKDYSCGKYGCQPRNDWHTIGTSSINKTEIALADILRNKEKKNLDITLHRTGGGGNPIDFGHYGDGGGGGGKYAS